MKLKIWKKKKFLFVPCLVLLMGIFLLPKPAFFAYLSEKDIISLSNAERKKKNIAALKKNEILTKIAETKGRAILEKQIFKHNFNNRVFSDWIKDEDYEYAYAGENLAIDFASNESLLRAWMDSESHRKNILNKRFTEIGVAIIEGEFRGENTIIIVQIFAAPLNALSSQKQNLDKFENQFTFLGAQDSDTIIKERESDIYQILDSHKLLFDKFNPLSSENIKISAGVTAFYSVLLLFLFIIHKNQAVLVKHFTNKK